MENNDNIVENFMFDFILRNPLIQQKLLELTSFIFSQKMAYSDIQDIFSAILWKHIVDENDEINEIIKNYREKNKIPKLYEILLWFIENKINLDDKISLNFIQNQLKYELEHNILNISIKIVDFLAKKIKKEISSKKSIFEIWVSDYMDEKEKEEFLNFIYNINYDFDEDDNKKIDWINELIKSFLKKNEIYNIK